MGLLDLLGFNKSTENISDFINKNAVILDVRTSEEFASGHIKGSKNIPLDMLSSEIENIQKLNQPVIACCRSGMRSAQATALLKKNGIETINGGGWESLQHKL
ncbi:rhodanese-like domain-containing protein [Flavobacterium sp. SM15]|uniref:rhodanese-like domain-containing protein n=1 Tax=Flavobacterium sp. SM15 TaxID=2908005 RepID=UPI001EDB2199|nr:rhodanese-like domain-containing protein [Flavobacterium sp. SM15]MCG2610629.1 rhodanese-like domain-containing protein [Flavobacterium sp. SM15]